MLFLGLFLASDLLGAPLPKTAQSSVLADPVVTSLAIQVRRQLFQAPRLSVGVLNRSMFYLRSLQGLTARSQYCLTQLLTSTPADWALLPLPGPLFPVYAVLRPIRLIAKYGGKLWRDA
jgi:hypothetical protein